MVLVFTITTQAQHVIELQEAILIAPNSTQISSQEDNFTFTVTEKYGQEFSKDPIAFQRRNFNILEYINHFKGRDYNTFYVILKSSNGLLKVQYDKNGKLLRNSQWFSDVELPGKIMRQLQKEHNGWVMTQNKSFSKGKGAMTQKIVYRIKLKNGDETRRIKIKSIPEEQIVVAEKQ